ncbi:MAG: hypothetical protein LBO07_01820 [Coriobacteriales bacterium]|jgi:hypothetical protein|nr:hypothetical protein [Coriobacteriales bacterium]
MKDTQTQKPHRFQVLGGFYLIFLTVIAAVTLFVLLLVALNMNGFLVVTDYYFRASYSMLGLFYIAYFCGIIVMLAFNAAFLVTALMRLRSFLNIFALSLLFDLIYLAGFFIAGLLFDDQAFRFIVIAEVLAMARFLPGAALLVYCVRSVRVRTYMKSDAYLTRSVFFKWKKPPRPAVPDETTCHLQSDERPLK